MLVHWSNFLKLTFPLTFFRLPSNLHSIKAEKKEIILSDSCSKFSITPVHNSSNCETKGLKFQTCLPNESRHKRKIHNKKLFQYQPKTWKKWHGSDIEGKKCARGIFTSFRPNLMFWAFHIWLKKDSMTFWQTH